MTEAPKLPITVLFLNGHNKLINFLLSNFHRRFSQESIQWVYAEWLRLKTGIEKYCVANSIDPDGLQIYTNACGMVEKMGVLFSGKEHFRNFDLRITLSQSRIISDLRLSSFEQGSGKPSIYFKKDNPNEPKPVGFL